MSRLVATDKHADDRIRAFGRNVRRARRFAGLSQQRLADLSGLSQSVISRLERGVAPYLGLSRILALQEVLGGCLPLGVCPHDHSCIWGPQSPEDYRLRHAPATALQRRLVQFESDSLVEYRRLLQSPSPTKPVQPTGLDTQESFPQAGAQPSARPAEGPGAELPDWLVSTDW